MYCFTWDLCFICRPSDSTVAEDAGIEPRTIATFALAVRRSNHSARSPPFRLDLNHSRLDVTHKGRSHLYTRPDLIHTRQDLVHKVRSHPQAIELNHKARSHPWLGLYCRNLIYLPLEIYCLRYRFSFLPLYLGVLMPENVYVGRKEKSKNLVCGVQPQKFAPGLN